MNPRNDWKATVEAVLPALEKASGIKAGSFDAPRGASQACWSALWLARAILETPTRSGSRKKRPF